MSVCYIVLQILHYTVVFHSVFLEQERLSFTQKTVPVIRLENIAKSAQVKRVLSDLIEKEREDKKVVGRDMYGAVSHIDPVEFDGDGDMDDHNFN